MNMTSLSRLSAVVLLTLWNLPGARSMALEAEWMSYPSANRISPRRSGHTAFTAGPSDPCFVFGGYIEKDPDKEGEPCFREVRNDLWNWNDKAQNWEEAITTGDIPGPRLASASAVATDGKAYLFGGWDPETAGTGGSILESVHSLDLASLEWTKLMKDLPDGPTSRHVAVALTQRQEKTKILVHNHRSTDHVWLFDPETGDFTKQVTTGDSPGSLGLHTATMLDDSTLLLFGGAAKNGEMSNKSYILNTKTWKWNKVEIDETSCPSPRAGACLVSCTTNGILFGGAETTETGLNPKGDVWALRLSDVKSGVYKGTWTMLLDDKKDTVDSTIWPEPRNAATLSPIASDDPGTTKFLMTGGWAPFRKTFDDVFVLSIKE